MGRVNSPELTVSTLQNTKRRNSQSFKIMWPISTLSITHAVYPKDTAGHPRETGKHLPPAWWPMAANSFSRVFIPKIQKIH